MTHPHLPTLPQPPAVPVDLLIAKLRDELAHCGPAVTHPFSVKTVREIINALEWHQCRIATLETVANLAAELVPELAAQDK